MFRLFLRKKILSGEESTATVKRSSHSKAVVNGSDAEAPRRNRRVFARYAIDHKHLTLMNDQDILLVREISAKGFSTEVSPRGYERLVVGDVYDARIRYLGEVYDLQAKVAWKHDSFVGFEIVKANRDALVFIKRLLRPIEIASSLQPVEASFLNNPTPTTSDSEGGTSDGAHTKTWYHGDEESDLYVWHDPETSALTAWQLAVGENYVEWNETRGLSTGSLKAIQGREALIGANLQGLSHREDGQVDTQKRQFAVDVIMALQFPERERILETVTA